MRAVVVKVFLGYCCNVSDAKEKDDRKITACESKEVWAASAVGEGMRPCNSTIARRKGNVCGGVETS